jgi:cell division protein FtsN
MPPAGSSKLYRLQVGAFIVPRNAVDAFEKLKKAGLDPKYAQNGEFYRVVLPGLTAGEIPLVAQMLGNTGFPEAIIREEN